VGGPPRRGRAPPASRCSRLASMRSRQRALSCFSRCSLCGSNEAVGLASVARAHLPGVGVFGCALRASLVAGRSSGDALKAFLGLKRSRPEGGCRTLVSLVASARGRRADGTAVVILPLSASPSTQGAWWRGSGSGHYRRLEGGYPYG